MLRFISTRDIFLNNYFKKANKLDDNLQVIDTYEIISSGVIGSDKEDEIKITRKAINEVKRIIQENKIPDEYFFRIKTSGGGCLGMNYGVGFDADIEESDRIFELEDLNVVIDSKSLFYVMGLTIDFTNDVVGKGFTFKGLYNMNTCGCNH